LEQAPYFLNSLARRIRHGNDHLIQFPGPAVEQAFRHPDNGNFMNAPVPFLNIVVKEGHYDSPELLSDG